MPDDFGFYGKGASGYVHYMQAHEEGHRSGRGRRPSSNGCLTLAVQIVASGLMIALVIATLI